ncbi:hypothetical protein [uncultured Thermanaerothrix sp.]|uniref:hypothetical protein n=1 Tax=uncultured Thermanaerothrix sp. TaxID=1195149 RepID=UPI00260A70CD|nr:hypothetical protein [uncultured Thermanaerothrix sp.]
MIFTPSLRAAIEQELAQAERARQAGNEGQARVCARRAVGLALQAFWDKDEQTESSSVIRLFERLRESETLPEALRQAADHFLMRVTPEFRLPVDVDLVAEARWLITELERLHTTESTDEN